MSKTFTCRELGGLCEEKISGDSFNEVIQKGMAHMQSDEVHKKHMMNLANATGENKEEWFARMQKEFDARRDDIV